MSNISYYTPEGFFKIQQELEELKTQGRKFIAQQIAEARSKGDLSENAEYDAAKHEQGLLELKIAKLEKIIQNARILQKSQIDTSQVSLFTKVKVKNIQYNTIHIYTIVAEEEADLEQGKISIKSPIARGILGKKVGEIGKIKVPLGELELEIMSIA